MDLREMPQSHESHPRGAPRSRHPWEQSRARFFRERLAPHLRPGVRVVDIGAGDGYLAASLLPRLQPGGQVVCFDTGYSDEHLARFSADAPVGLHFTRERPEPGAEIVLLLDVLEHVADDRGFLVDVVDNLLAPGGVLLASVPAHPALFTHHDLVLGHRRRYRPGDLLRLMRDAGLAVEVNAGLFHSLLPVRVLQKLGERVRGIEARPSFDIVPDHADTGLTAWNRGPWLSNAILAALSLDHRLSAACANRGIVLPGLSVWALAQKP
jgi:SAM-dependent methyltransferase